MSTATLPASLTAPDNYAYRERDWRRPTVPDGASVVFDEPGRVLNNVCYRAYHFLLIRPEYGPFTLAVRHGGGEESWRITYTKQTIEGLAGMDSDSRYLILHALMDAHHQSASKASEATASTWRKAAAQKRIKTRKVKAGVKVWIEPEVMP